MEYKHAELVKTENVMMVTRGWSEGIGDMLFKVTNLELVDK